ncbi:unnamed protein product [Rotaria sordida]|uniref:Uncharacterized protein n=1 Tax=Rotaria sordida TaxID=392033 RepID=A0A814KCG6_9BILA|nr:unnamed protein product [Rotaria sordida]CAF3924401.1 unnamed protein product [Rotaria sordida]
MNRFDVMWDRTILEELHRNYCQQYRKVNIDDLAPIIHTMDNSLPPPPPPQTEWHEATDDNNALTVLHDMTNPVEFRIPDNKEQHQQWLALIESYRQYRQQ